MENLLELSKATLKSYAKKSLKDNMKRNSKGGLDTKAYKRAKGIRLATKKLGISHRDAEHASGLTQTPFTKEYYGKKESSRLSKLATKHKNKFNKTVDSVKEEYTEMNLLYELLELIATGEQEQADELFDSLVGERVSDILDQTRADLAAQIFASTEGEVIEEGEVKKANKAKKNAHTDKVGAKNSYELLIPDERRAGRVSMSGKYQRGDKPKDTLHAKKSATHGDKKHTSRMSRLAIKREKKPNLPESTDLQELSKKTLGSYVSKAASDAFGAGHDAGSAKLGSAKSMKGYEKGTKRLAGIRKAAAKLTRESLERLVEANKENKAKKNSHEDSVGKKMIKKLDDKGQNVRSDTRNNPRRLTRIGRSMGFADKTMSEAMSDELKAKVKADMEKRRAAKNAALDSAKKEMEGWKPDKKDIRKLYKKED